MRREPVGSPDLEARLIRVGLSQVCAATAAVLTVGLPEEEDQISGRRGSVATLLPRDPTRARRG